MSDEGLRPVEGDQTADQVQAALDLAGAEWLLTSAGDYNSFAVEKFNTDGTEELAIVLEWPCRVNKTNDERVIRLVIHPDDALALSGVLAHTSGWLKEYERLNPPPKEN